MKKSGWFYVACLFGPRFTVWLALAYYVAPLLAFIGCLALLATALVR